MTMIGRDGNPQQKNLRQILTEWVDFRTHTVERRSRHRLAEVERRMHICDGRMIAFLRIEEVIRVIRESDEPKPSLMEAFGLSEIQADDILEIRLRQLARLEGIRIEKELAELRSERKALQNLLDSRSARTRAIVKEIEADARKHGDARRTLIEAVAATPSGRSELKINVPDEPVTVILSKAGWLRSRQGHGVATESISYKTGDTAFAIFETRTTWPLLLLDSHGRAYTLPVAAIPGGKGDGVPLTTMIELQDGGKVVQALSAAPEKQYLFANSGGYGFVAAVADLAGRNKAGKAFMTLEPGETLLAPVAVNGTHIFAASSNGRLLVFDAAEMKTLAKGRGVIIMALDDRCTLAALGYCDGHKLSLPVRERGKVTQLNLSGADMRKYQLHRARKGLQLPGKKLPS
jgi:topoisomerase-4 subunit A